MEKQLLALHSTAQNGRFYTLTFLTRFFLQHEAIPPSKEVPKYPLLLNLLLIPAAWPDIALHLLLLISHHFNLYMHSLSIQALPHLYIRANILIKAIGTYITAAKSN